MKLIFLYGMPATGKLTIGQELAAITGYKLFHNHLVVDMLLNVFEFGSPQFIELREQYWLSIFEQAAQAGLSGMIFTFNPESTVRPVFISNTLVTISKSGGDVDFIELTCPVPELKRRMSSLARLKHKKLASPALFEELHKEGAFDVSYMPKPRMSICTSVDQPPRVALQIARELNLMPVK